MSPKQPQSIFHSLITKTMLQNRYFLLAIILPILALFLVNVTNKNRCETYLSYLLINFSDRCSYDPNVDLDPVSKT